MGFSNNRPSGFPIPKMAVSMRCELLLACSVSSKCCAPNVAGSLLVWPVVGLHFLVPQGLSEALWLVLANDMSGSDMYHAQAEAFKCWCEPERVCLLPFPLLWQLAVVQRVAALSNLGPEDTASWVPADLRWPCKRRNKPLRFLDCLVTQYELTQRISHFFPSMFLHYWAFVWVTAINFDRN